jgi:hypothetical protein
MQNLAGGKIHFKAAEPQRRHSMLHNYVFRKMVEFPRIETRGEFLSLALHNTSANTAS